MHTELHHVLPIQPGIQSPNAFEVFGLSPDKSEPAAIKLAIEQTIARLKDEKANIDPGLWRRVVALVQEGKTTLADANSREKLRKQLSQAGQPKPAPKQPIVNDPLADLLPTANPTAAVPTETPKEPDQPAETAEEKEEDAEEVLSPAIIAAPPEPIPANALEGIALPNQPSRGGSRRKRKRRSILGPALMFGTSLAMLAILGGIAYFLLAGPNRIAVSEKDGSISITSTETEVDDGNAPAGAEGEGDIDNAPPGMVRDPVMGTLMPDNPPPQVPPANPSPDPQPNTVAEEPTSADPKPMMTPPSEPTVVEPEVSGEVPEDIVEISKSLERAIEASQWDQMEQLSEQIPINLPPEDSRTQSVLSIRAIGDLASYYRGALIRGMIAQPTASTITLEGRPAIGVVEAKADKMVLRIGGKNITYPIDELPFVLIQFLVREEIPDPAITEAAQWVYRFVWPLSTESHKREAIESLRALDPTSVEGVASLGHVADQLDQMLPSQ